MGAYKLSNSGEMAWKFLMELQFEFRIFVTQISVDKNNVNYFKEFQINESDKTKMNIKGMKCFTVNVWKQF